MRTSRPLLIAHRGGAPKESDNSPRAFDQALKIGVDMLECDLRRSVDGHLVLLHDASLRGDAGQRLVVADSTLSALKAVIPWLLTLDEFLEQFGRRLPFNLDLKTYGYEQEALRAIERHRLARQTLFSTVHTLSLRRLASANPALRLGLSRGHLNSSLPLRAATRWLQSTLPRLLPALLLAARATEAMLQHRVITPELTRRLHAGGYRVFAWTVDEPEEARRLAAAGVDGIASNVPALLRGVL